MLEASNWKTMESWYQNLSPYVNDKEFPLRGGKKDLPPVLIGLKSERSWRLEKALQALISNQDKGLQKIFKG